MNPASAPVSRPVSNGAPKKKSKMKWFIIGGVILLIALVVGAKMKSQRSQQGAPVTVEKAVIKTITQLVNATGKIQPELEIKISPEVSGEIIELPLREGAEVAFLPPVSGG